MTNPALELAPLAQRREELAARISDLRGRSTIPNEDTLARFMRLDADFQALADDARARLLGTGLAWTEEDRCELAWLRHSNDDLAVIGYTLSRAFGQHRGYADDRTLRLMARTLVNMGHVVKWEVAVTRGAPHDFAKPHALMRAAMQAEAHAMPLAIRHDGRDIACTLESLYFRTLLLARFSSGALNMKQIEILDSWMWLWMPALQAVEQCPGDSALRADLDSTEGLRRGPRPGSGPSLYLPPAPIDEAYRAILREFHAGRMVPSHGMASTFRIEEHVAVLDLIRAGLRESPHSPVSRAERRESSYFVELFVGLSEVMTRGFSPIAAPNAPTLTLAASDGLRLVEPKAAADGLATESIYERHRRMVRVGNVSETGFGMEGSDRDCGDLAVGDIVALRLEPSAPLEICKVARCVPTGTAGRVWVGVKRLSARARPLPVTQPTATSAREREATVAFVPGEDEGGRHDACLVTDRAFADSEPLQARLGNRVYTFRFNRPRERGRGWVLAGFEVVAANEVV